MSLLERVIGQINANAFLREFTFSRTQFRPEPKRELEFADLVTALGQNLMLYQIKERTGTGDADAWFRKKVLGRATKQIRDTLRYLDTHQEITLTNNRGHESTIGAAQYSRRVKIVVYYARPYTELMLSTRHHQSSTAGVIHVLRAHDYERLCNLLATPAEILEYLAFRERLLAAYDGLPDEKALAGQFLSGHLEAAPERAFAGFVDRLKGSPQPWDISHITSRFGDRITTQLTGVDLTPGGATQYYRILEELALLGRTELAHFRQRFDMCLDAAGRGEFKAPLRMIPFTGCGFLFVAVPPDRAPDRIQGLLNLTLGSKYERRVEKHIGVGFASDGNDILIDWVFVEFPWAPNPQMEDMLRTSNPFRPLKDRMILRYDFAPGGGANGT